MATRPIAPTKKTSPSLSPRKLSIRAQSKPSSSAIPNLKRLFSVPSIAMLAAASPLPALAEQMEKAALFEFNLTLPIIAIEFLLLMVALDKLYFSPLGKFMDERDAKIRSELSEVQLLNFLAMKYKCSCVGLKGITIERSKSIALLCFSSIA